MHARTADFLTFVERSAGTYIRMLFAHAMLRALHADEAKADRSPRYKAAK
jgi:hypothetical protein